VPVVELLTVVVTGLPLPKPLNWLEDPEPAKDGAAESISNAIPRARPRQR